MIRDNRFIVNSIFRTKYFRQNFWLIIKHLSSFMSKYWKKMQSVLNVLYWNIPYFNSLIFSCFSKHGLFVVFSFLVSPEQVLCLTLSLSFLFLLIMYIFYSYWHLLFLFSICCSCYIFCKFVSILLLLTYIFSANFLITTVLFDKSVESL